jgi:hypothetical protein
MSIIIKKSNKTNIINCYNTFKFLRYETIFDDENKKFNENGLYITDEILNNEKKLKIYNKFKCEYFININFLNDYIFVDFNILNNKFNYIMNSNRELFLSKYNFNNIDISRKNDKVSSLKIKKYLKEYKNIINKKINYSIIINNENIIITTDFNEFLNCIYNECNVFLYDNNLKLNNEFDTVIINDNNILDKINNIYNINDYKYIKELKLVLLSLLYTNYSYITGIKKFINNI